MKVLSDNFIFKYIYKGHPRSVTAKKNIIGSIILKLLNNIINLLLVPIILNYLNPTKYGIWLTLSSVVAWFSFFNFGITSGLRNKFAEAISQGNHCLAKDLVSTAYITTTIFIFIIYLIFLVINPYLDFVKIFNVPQYLSGEVYNLVTVVFTFFSVQFVLNILNSIIAGDQKNVLTELLNLIISVFSLIAVIILTLISDGSLILLGTVMSSTPMVILFIASLVLFQKKYNKYIPSFKNVKIKAAKDLLGVSSQFFIIQISGIILFSTDNIIVTQLFGPAEVTPYNIAFRYFNFASIIFVMIANPFWSAFTEAYISQEIEWIKRIVRKMLVIWVFCALVVLFMLGMANMVYSIWVGEIIVVSNLLSTFMAVFTLIFTWNIPFVYFINGIGKIRLQTYYAIISGIINIPLSIFLAKNYGLNSAGVILATCICALPTVFLWPIQYSKIINLRAKGIWSK